MPKKPTEKIVKSFDWTEVQDFIEKKHKMKFRGYKEKLDGEYRDFWLWVTGNFGIHNGCYFTLDKNEIEQEEWWVKEIVELIFKEFGKGKDEIDFYCWW